MRIAELPVRERPVLELLGFSGDRAELDRDYAGYGWARVPRVWLADGGGSLDERAARARPVDDALVLALHSPDDGEPLAGDIELELELPAGTPLPAGSPVPAVSVLLSRFLEIWLPRLPDAATVVLALCNPHRAILRPAGRPLRYALGDVEAWLDDRDRDRAPRVMLVAETWCTLQA